MADVKEKTANEQILDAVIRHQIFLLRYSGFVRNRINLILNRNEKELQTYIIRKFGGMKKVTTTAEWRRLQTLLTGITALRMESWQQAQELLLKQMEEFALQEPQMLQKIYSVPLPVQIHYILPSTRLLRSIALSRPFEGRVLSEWADSMAESDIRRIHGAVQTGMVAGEGMDKIVKRVIGTGRLQGADGQTEMTRRQVTAVVRTAVQHVSNGARDAFFDENKDLFTEEQFVATLDSRTTPICRALDGKHFEVGKGPRPPLHFNCRSVRVAAINGAFAGERPAKPTTERILVKEYARNNGYGEIRSRDQLPRGTKTDYDQYARKRIRELVGPISASETYQTWLMQQSVAFQEEVLGEKKAKLFRSGGLTLDKFVDLNTQHEFTLKELAFKHKEAFIAAGLDPD